MIKNFLISGVKLNSKKLCLNNLKNFGMYRGNRELSKDYEREKSVYKKEKKAMLKQHTEDFWKEQTRVENEWLENFLKTQQEKKQRDDAKLRNSIIKNSYQCYLNIKKEIENQQAFLAKQKLWREEDTQLLMEKHSILTMLDRQAEEDWLTPENIDTKLNQQLNQILPPTILSHVDYYKKLNNYAMLMEQGFSKEAEEAKLNKKIIDYKNKQLQPIYEELKTLIRHFTYTEEHSVYELYQESILRIENYLQNKDNEKDFIQVKDNLGFLFKRLISLMRAENEKPDNKLELIESQLKHLTMILVLWSKYVEVIYRPDSEIEEMLQRKHKENEDESKEDNINQRSLEDLVEEKDPKVLKDYYFSRVTEKRSKGSGIFIQDFRGLYDDDIIRKVVESNQGQAEETDVKNSTYEEYTTESDDEEGKTNTRLGNAEDRKDNKKNKQLLGSDRSIGSDRKKTKAQTMKQNVKRVQGDKRKLIENELSEVFEEEWEEEQGSSQEQGEKESKENKLNTATGEINYTNQSSNVNSDSTISSNLKDKSQTKIKKEAKLLEEYMLMSIKNQAEKSAYSKLDVHSEFKKAKQNLVNELGLKNENELFADIDEELNKIDLSKIIDLNDYDIEIKKEQERVTLEKEFKGIKTEDLFTSSLFNTILKYSKDIFDFNKPKISTNLDIYDENLIRFLEYSVEEANLIYKSSSTSLIMEYIKEELKSINDEHLSPANRLKKNHLIRVAEVCARTRVPDSQNLKQVFEMFKNPSIKFA